MKQRRTIDNDGLDGVLPTAKSVSVEPKKSKLLWLIPVTLVIAVSVFLLNKQPNSTQPVASNNQVTASTEQKITQPNITESIAPSTPMKAENSDTNVAANNQTPENKPDLAESIAKTEQPLEPSTEPNVLNPTEAATATAPAVQQVISVYFKFDSTNPGSLPRTERAKLITLAKECKTQIILTGHTCNMGVDWSNQLLGLARANSIKQLLIKNGIPSHKVVTRSEGMLKPAVPNDTKSGQALNRRTEVVCIGSV